MEKHSDAPVTLGELCAYNNLSKSVFLRVFTRSGGVTPYRCLQVIRIYKAKEQLEEGVSPGEASLRTGFSDKNHFSDSFTAFIGFLVLSKKISSIRPDFE